MPFTSTSVANTGNIFRISRNLSTKILIIVQENALFNIVEKVMLLIPVIHENKFYVEMIQTERILNSLYQTKENQIQGSIPGKVHKISSCQIKNITSRNKLIPIPASTRSLALTIYEYEIEVIYMDTTGQAKKIILKSGQRLQRAFTDSLSGSLKVSLTTDCLWYEILYHPSLIPAPNLYRSQLNLQQPRASVTIATKI